jgi:hypothetical protein
VSYQKNVVAWIDTTKQRMAAAGQGTRLYYILEKDLRMYEDLLIDLKKRAAPKQGTLPGHDREPGDESENES